MAEALGPSFEAPQEGRFAAWDRYAAAYPAEADDMLRVLTVAAQKRAEATGRSVRDVMDEDLEAVDATLLIRELHHSVEVPSTEEEPERIYRDEPPVSPNVE